MNELKERVKKFMTSKLDMSRNQKRQNLIGSGGRGDKVKTYRDQDNIVIDHRDNTKKT